MATAQPLTKLDKFDSHFIIDMENENKSQINEIICVHLQKSVL